MSYVITAHCLNCRAAVCYAVCPADAVGGGDLGQQMYIDPDLCIQCGICAEACPIDAIYPEEDLPRRWSHYAEINRAFFHRPT